MTGLPQVRLLMILGTTTRKPRVSRYDDALKGYAADHVFEFDKHHLDRCDTAILVLPAGKSGHLTWLYAGSGSVVLSSLTLSQQRWM